MASRTTTDPIEILLEMGIDLDNLSEEEDYLSALKEAIATILYKTKGKGNKKSKILIEEVVKIRKGRKAADTKFKAKTTRVSGTRLLGTSAIAPKKTTVRKETFLALPPAMQEEESPQEKKARARKRAKPEKNLLAEIAKSVSNIADILKDQYNLKKKEGEFDRKKAQRDKRNLQESGLEKRFQTLFKAAQKIIEPVRSLFDKIFGFLFNVLLAKFLTKIVDWIANPENQKKIQSIIRFFGDHWKKLLSLYLVFGTGFGRFVLSLTKVLIGGAVKLGIAIAKLAAAKGVGGARKLAGMLGGKRAKFLIGAASTALTVGGTMAGVNSLTSNGGQQQTQGFAGGGLASPKAPKIGSSMGGGFNFGGGFGGSLFGSLGSLMGSGIGGLFGNSDTAKLSKPANVELEIPSGTEGEVDGPGGTDKVPAMLTAGEFVMSRGAVQKYGVKQLEAMNAAGGGTNRPKVVDNKVRASVGGYINLPGMKFDRRTGTPEESKGSPRIPLSGINISKFSSDIMRAFSNLSASRSSSGTSTGSLLTDPVGAISRIASNMGVKTPNVSGGFKMPTLPSNFKMPNLFGGGSKPKGKPNQKGFFQELQEKLSGSGAATYRDAGSIYAKQMLGGLFGPISERDLSKESQAELQKAIQRAKKRTGSEIRKAEAKIKELRGMGAKDGNPALETQKSFLRKLKAGGIRVQYADYADEKGKMSESAKNAKNILGQFWASQRSEKEGGGYRIEDKYDFDMFKKKDEKTGKMREMNTGELIMEGIFGKGKSVQQRLQAAYLLNPLKGKGDVDMVLGGKRTAKIGQTKPNVSPPAPPVSNGNVTVVKTSTGTPTDKSNSNRSGSNTPPVNAGNGDKGKWKIFGIPMPF